MSTTETVKIEAAFFETPEGEQFLDQYTQWKQGSAVSEDVKRRREKLASLKALVGVTGSSKGFTNGTTTDYVLKVYETQDGLSQKQVTDAVNAILKEEGNGETVSNASVGPVLYKHLCEPSKDDDGNEVPAVLRREEKKEGKKVVAYYFKVTPRTPASRKKTAAA